VKNLRASPKDIAKGNITRTYAGDSEDDDRILQSVLATELVCVLRLHDARRRRDRHLQRGREAEFANPRKESRSTR